MKKNLFFSMLAAVVLTLGFVACSNDDNNGGKSEEAEDTDRVRVSEWDAFIFFQHAIATCDQNGENFESFNWGVELYPDDPGHLYIGVDTWQEAVKIFNYWLAPNVRLAKVPSSAEPLQIGLPDLKGEKQLDVFLKPGETDGVVAELTMSDEAPIKHFYKITFLKNSDRPTNKAGTRSDSGWEVGDIVKNVTITSENSIEDKLNSDDKQLDFVCVRASGNGVNPWFVTTTIHDSYKCGTSSRPTYSRIRKAYWTPDYDTAYEIRDLMKENWDTIKSAWSNADNGEFPDQEDDKEPFIDRCHYHCSHFYDTYNFDTDYINGREIGAGCAFFLNFNNYGADDVYDGYHMAWCQR